MKRLFLAPCIMLLVVAQFSVARAAAPADLSRGVPEDVYLMVQAKHNPERDYQQKYYEDVWSTVQETKIVDKVIAMITSQVGEQDMEKAKAVLQEIQDAAKPIDIEAVMGCKEMIYAQKMEMAPMPTSQHLMLMRLTPDAAASMVEGMKNLFGLIEKYSEGEVAVTEDKIGDVVINGLGLPPQVPMQPLFGHMDDVFVFCTSRQMLETSLGMLAGGEGKSKFDDPRLAAALAKLPKPEDSLVFYDGKTQFETLRELGPFIAQMGGGDPNVGRVVEIIDMVMNDVAILDYQVTVEYTEGNLNRSASFGKLLPGTEDATLRKMIDSGQPFEKWQAWVPAGALSYSLGTGVNLHPAYERIMSILKEKVPEAADGLAQFEQIQDQIDIHLDADILQAFSGEYASVTMGSEMGRPESLLALRCQKPERIKELIHRGMEALLQIEAVKAQQIKLVECKDLEGFEEVSVPMLMAFQVRPVIGFRDGWMYIASSPGAVQKVLDAQAGKGETIDQTDAYKRLGLDVQGDVASISYANTAESTRNMAKALNQVGFMAPAFLASAAAQSDDEGLKIVTELVKLLPDVAKIVRKFDFLEARMTVAQEGDEPDTFMTRSVVVVRPADAESN